jgi:alpha-glucoside transport system substrate-binding protein
MRRLATPLLRFALVLGLVAAPAACAGPQENGTVTIMVPWSDDEFAAFHAVVEAFKERNPGIDVKALATRALTQQLDAAVAADAKPDLAVLPSVGAIAKYRQEGALRELSVDAGEFVQPFRGLGMVGEAVYAVPVKADVKSLIWYDSRAAAPPADADSRPGSPWCLGLESGPTSGWPGADWIADILLATHGDDDYTRWALGTKGPAGPAKWSTGPVHDAWTTWGKVVGTALDNAANVPFRAAAEDVTGRKCSLWHGALSAMPFDAAEVKEKGGYTFVPPTREALQVSADFVGKLTENENADRFIAFMASAPAQRAWVDKPGFALSAHSRVTNYANPVQGRIAALLRPPAHRLCFSAADAMDPDVSAAFYRAVVEYANGKPQRTLLAALDRIQDALGYADPESSPRPAPLCSTPDHP